MNYLSSTPVLAVETPASTRCLESLIDDYYEISALLDLNFEKYDAPYHAARQAVIEAPVHTPSDVALKLQWCADNDQNMGHKHFKAFTSPMIDVLKHSAVIPQSTIPTPETAAAFAAYNNASGGGL